jgi:periplasmic divalent cation tolerance protein
MAEVRVVLVTAPDEDSALALARALVDERLVACGTVLPGIRSVYRWEGEVHADPEALLMLKAPAARIAALLRRVPELHPYDVPEILVLDVSEGHAPYLDWVAREADPSKAR